MSVFIVTGIFGILIGAFGAWAGYTGNRDAKNAARNK
jgi:hypothetical protein